MFSILKNGGLVTNYLMLDFVREIWIQPTEKNLRAGCLHTYAHIQSGSRSRQHRLCVYSLSLSLTLTHVRRILIVL